METKKTEVEQPIYEKYYDFSMKWIADSIEDEVLTEEQEVLIKKIICETHTVISSMKDYNKLESINRTIEEDSDFEYVKRRLKFAKIGLIKVVTNLED